MAMPRAGGVVIPVWWRRWAGHSRPSGPAARRVVAGGVPTVGRSACWYHAHVLRIGWVAAADSLHGVSWPDLEIAHVDGDSIVGLALDLPEFYDHLPLALACRSLLRAVCSLSMPWGAGSMPIALLPGCDAAVGVGGVVLGGGRPTPCGLTTRLRRRHGSAVQWGGPRAGVAARLARVSELRRCVRVAVAGKRQLLRRCVGPPVATHLEELGDDQQVGQRREGHVAVDLIAGGAERLRRCRSLFAGFAQRMRVMAAAGLPAALYGIGGSVWPLRLLAFAPGGVLWVVMQFTFGGAPEAYSAPLACTWREDAGRWAVVALWRFVHDARGVPAVVADLLLHSHRPVGPVAALRRSLLLAGLTVLGDHDGLALWRWQLGGSPATSRVGGLRCFLAQRLALV